HDVGDAVRIDRGVEIPRGRAGGPELGRRLEHLAVGAPPRAPDRLAPVFGLLDPRDEDPLAGMRADDRIARRALADRQGPLPAQAVLRAPECETRIQPAVDVLVVPRDREPVARRVDIRLVGLLGIVRDPVLASLVPPLGVELADVDLGIAVACVVPRDDETLRPRRETDLVGAETAVADLQVLREHGRHGANGDRARRGTRDRPAPLRPGAAAQADESVDREQSRPPMATRGAALVGFFRARRKRSNDARGTGLPKPETWHGSWSAVVLRGADMPIHRRDTPTTARHTTREPGEREPPTSARDFLPARRTLPSLRRAAA